MAKRTMDYSEYAKAGGKGYGGYKEMAKGKKMAYMSPEEYSKAEEDADSDEDEDEDEDEDDAEKSHVSADELLKAIGDYEAVEEALTVGGNTRESILTSKLNDGTISKSEQAELGSIWADTNDYGATEPLNKSLLNAIEDDDPDAAAMVDASDFLKSLVTGAQSVFTDVRDDVLRDGNATRTLLRGQGSLVKSLAGLVAEQDGLLKSQNAVMVEMGKRLGVLEGEPMVRKSRGADPRDVRPREPGNLGRGGDNPNDKQITKSMIFRGINQLLQKAEDAHDDVALDRLSHASTLLETSGQINPNIYAAIKQELDL